MGKRIDFLYPFHFDGRGRKTAIERLKKSLHSIKDQDVNICICNTSKECIWGDIKKFNPKYVHKYNDSGFCKPLTINYGVKKLVDTPYFILSDIDLIYQKDYVKLLMNYTHSPQCYRVIPYNFNMSIRASQIKSAEQCINNLNKIDKYRTGYGIAPGNGLIHTKSFYFIGGYDEQIHGYGPEDADFNERIKYINCYVEDKNKSLTTFHIYHPLAKQNSRTFSYEKEFQMRKKWLYENLNGFDFFKCDNKEWFLNKLRIINANWQKSWGEI